MKYAYQTSGTCSTLIHLDVTEGILNDVWFENGCDGNLQGISQLIRGMKVADVIQKLEGIRCGMKTTSCPDQLCRVLHEMGY